MWRTVRGAGLAYGANVYTDVERGFTYFNVYRSPDSVKAYVAAKKAVEAMVAGDLVSLILLSIRLFLTISTCRCPLTNCDLMVPRAN